MTKIEKRQKCNNEIIQKLSKYINKYPQIRFLQALYNLNIIRINEDQWYEESQDTLKNIKKEKK